ELLPAGHDERELHRHGRVREPGDLRLRRDGPDDDARALSHEVLRSSPDAAISARPRRVAERTPLSPLLPSPRSSALSASPRSTSGTSSSSPAAAFAAA